MHENNTLECEIYTHARKFFNIFLLRHGHFSKHTPECDFNMHLCDLITKNVISTRESVIPTRKVCFPYERV
jgi:hypothetical protein